MKTLLLLAFSLVLVAPTAARADARTEATGGDPPTDGASDAMVTEGTVAQAGADTDDVIAEERDDDTDGEEGRDGVDWPFGWSIGTGVSTSAGNVFRPGVPLTERDDSVLNSWTFGINKQLTDGLVGAIGWGFYKYLTTAGGSTLQREARINDLALNLAYGPIYVIPRADVSISASLSGIVPLSRMSRTSTLRTTLLPGLSFGRSFGNLALGYRFGASKSFHRFTSSVVDATDVDAIRRTGGAEDISANEVAEAGVNAEWGIVHQLSLAYKWFDGFNTMLAWGYAKSWAYDVVDCDEFSSEFANCSNRVARDSMTGMIAASYTFADHYTVSLTALTAQRPKTADNRRFNFPFWDLQSAGLFATSMSLDLGVTF